MSLISIHNQIRLNYNLIKNQKSIIIYYNLYYKYHAQPYHLTSPTLNVYKLIQCNAMHTSFFLKFGLALQSTDNLGEMKLVIIAFNLILIPTVILGKSVKGVK